MTRPRQREEEQPSNALRTRRTKRSVALTGASSFLGRNLIGVLEEDPSIGTIVALDVERPATSGPKTRFYKIDLTQPLADARVAETLEAEGVDTFVHLAFLSSPSYSAGWAHELESVGTMHVLNACRQRPVSRFVMRSQTLLYGPHPSNPNFLTEAHPLRGMKSSPFVRDKIQAEEEVRAFASEPRGTQVTVLRFAPLLGPHVHNFVTRWLTRRLVPTMMGFDPLVQFVHELDAIAALRIALDSEASGVFNIVGEGVLPVTTVVKLAGRVAAPVPRFLAQPAADILFGAHLNEAPGAFLGFLRFLCVADGALAAAKLGFRPAFTTREAVLDFGGVLRLRDAHLLSETL